MSKKELYMKRCFDLAKLGGTAVSPNPQVGAVLVFEDQILGEGYHQTYGGAHAEVNAINSVKELNKKHLKKASLYVSLEPCSHQGKTPPCVDLILKHRIPHVLISCQDPNPLVSGSGIKKLIAAGVKVEVGILELEGKILLGGFYNIHSQKAPKVILKFAQSQDGFLGKKDRPVWLTNSFSKRLVHKWRSEVDAIMVGTNTAEIDNPTLTSRFHFTPSPLRIVLDRKGRLNPKSKFFNEESPSLLVTENKNLESTNNYLPNVAILKIPFTKQLLPALLSHLYEKKCSQLLIEGGAHLLQSFIASGLWDEARVFISPKVLNSGVKAPLVPLEKNVKKLQLLEDQLFVYKNDKLKGLE